MEREFTKPYVVGGSQDKPAGNPSYQVWRDIRERSVLGFVHDVSRELGGGMDRALRQQLYDVVFANGLKTVLWRGVAYDGPMLLDLHRRARRES